MEQAAVARVFEGVGERLDADAVETVLAIAGACESAGAPTRDDLQDLCASLDAISANFAKLQSNEKMGMAVAVLEAVHQPQSSSERSGQAASNSCRDVPGAGCRPGLQTLRELCPGIAPDFLDHVLCREMGDVEAAAIWLTGREGLAREADRWAAAQQAAAARQADAERAERASRKALLNRFAFQPAPAAAAAQGRHPKGGKRAVVDPGPPEPAGSKVRYRDGMPVASRGERFVLQPGKLPEWDGGSQGKVFTKGKRGKGVA